jgi:hypothetical protein
VVSAGYRVERVDGSVRLVHDATEVTVCCDSFTVPEARRLAAALVEVCDRVEAAAS